MRWLYFFIKKSIFGFVFFISGCSSFFSGYSHNPIPDSDREAAKNASNNLHEIASVYYNYGDRKPFVINLVFDGTENNKDNVDYSSERETVAALLYKKLFLENKNTEYFPGPGVDSKYDAAKCTSCIPKANAAMGYVENILKIHGAETYDYKVVVIGFSRGAAIGRHFMNLMSDKWKAGEAVAVRSHAVLFDTVATGQLDNLRLGISTTTDYLVHVVARDERRNTLFGVVVDQDFDFEVEKGEGYRKSKRFLELTVPGVHSDIGGSYLAGIGSLYRVLAEEILLEMDIISGNEWNLGDGVFDYGVHDSRGIFDKMLFVKSFDADPDSIRKKIVFNAEKLAVSEKQEIIGRLNSSFDSKYNNRVRSKFKNYGTNAETVKFKVLNIHDSLKFHAVSYWINPNTIFYNRESRRLIFEGYEFNGEIPKSNIFLVDDVFFGLEKNEISNFEIVISVVKNRNEVNKFINFYVNRRKIYQLTAR